ncbi:MAG: DUF2231 domain-containing protein [Terriglobales bacterium]
MPDSLAQTVSRQNWLDRPAERLQAAATRAFERMGPRAEPTYRALHGTRLGHPLHVMLTDIPIGAWTAAVAFDGLSRLQPGRDWDRAARGALAVGLTGALGAVVTGLTDWSRLDAAPRRIGLAHAGLNLLSALAMTTSLMRRRRPGHGRRSALAGYALMLAAARLGGSLVYEHGIGATAREAVPPSQVA